MPKAPTQEAESPLRRKEKSRNLPVEGTNLHDECRSEPVEGGALPVREFTRHEWCLLLRWFSMSQVYWFMHNNETKVGDFVDLVLVDEETRTPTPSRPKKDIPDDYLHDLLRDDYQSEMESEEETISLRYCVVYEDFGCKDEMVRCHKCGYWYHSRCAEEPDREGKKDPNFSFWLCPKCKPDPKVDPSYKFTYRSKEDIEKDKHYEDSDYELEPYFRVFT